jgi:hypothetical protein
MRAAAAPADGARVRWPSSTGAGGAAGIGSLSLRAAIQRERTVSRPRRRSISAVGSVYGPEVS